MTFGMICKCLNFTHAIFVFIRINLKKNVYFSAKQIEFDARCFAVKVAKLGDSDLWDRFKLKLLEIQCSMGININPDAFLFICYIVIGILAFVVLKIAFSILKCVYKTLTCSESKKPMIVSIGHLRVLPIDDPHPYSQMV